MFGIYDGFSVWIVDLMGFGVFYFFGYVISVSFFGKFDVGYLMVIYMMDWVWMICDVIEIFFVVDVDIGFGGIVNVEEIVCVYEVVGVFVI